MRKTKTTYCVGKFPQLTRRVLTTADGLKSNNITAMCFDKNEVLYVGTDKGLSKLDGDKFVSVPTGGKEDNITMVCFNEENHLIVGIGSKLIEFDGRKKVASKNFDSDLVDVQVDGDGATWVLTKTVLYKLAGDYDTYEIKIGVPGEGSSLAVFKNNKVYVGTNGDGFHALAGKRWHWSELKSDATGILSDTITCLYTDPVGNIWIGTDKGICVHDDKSLWFDSSDVKELPQVCINGMAVTADGDKYFATPTGLIHQHNGILSYYGYKRWLPTPCANDVVVSSDGKVCVSTSEGLSLFETRMMTLEEKAIELRETTEKFNIRKDGYCIGRDLEHEGVVSLDEGYITNTDNDGMWTGLYASALCYEYACTKNEEVRKMAQRSLRAMIKLTEVSGIEGFTARAILYEGERDYGTGVRHEWHDAVDADGNKLEWLGETSSDEMVGHFYFYSTYYDLVADEQEKELIRSVCKKIINHIIDNKFRLIDTDGLPTTWANWDPDILNNDQKWIYEKGTNSLQILTFLKIVYHMTGEEKYNDLFNSLAGDKHFAMNLMHYKIADGNLLHIDDNHDFLMINKLMRYTDDAQLRAIFAIGLTDHWNDERVERNAFYNFTYGALTGEHCDIENAVDELIEYPMDQVAWTLYNSYRPDLKWNMEPVKLGMVPQLVEPLPAHERRIMNNDSNRFVADSGAEEFAKPIEGVNDGPTAYTMFPTTGEDKGMSFDACTNYTHPYWYARYYGLIKEI